MLDSFRSGIEGYFRDMLTTFTKFSHTVVNRVSEKGTFSQWFKLYYLFLSTKRMVGLRKTTQEAYHSLWMKENFEYQDGSNSTGQTTPTPSFRVKINDARNIYSARCFLNLTIAPNTDREIDDDVEEPVYEVDKMMGHRGEGDALEFHILWIGYDATPVSWEPRSKFNQTRIIDEH